MAPIVVDLTSSPEPKESPAKTANSALQSFKPRSQKANILRPPQNGLQSNPSLVNGSTPTAGGGPFTERQPHGLPLPRNHHAAIDEGPKQAPHAQIQPEYFLSNQISSVPALNLQPTRLQTARATTLPNKPTISKVPEAAPLKQIEQLTDRGNEVAVGVIDIDDDSRTSSSRASSDSDINTMLQAELNGARPLKRRRVNVPSEPMLERVDDETITRDSGKNFAPCSVVVGAAATHIIASGPSFGVQNVSHPSAVIREAPLRQAGEPPSPPRQMAGSIIAHLPRRQSHSTRMWTQKSIKDRAVPRIPHEAPAIKVRPGKGLASPKDSSCGLSHHSGESQELETLPQEPNEELMPRKIYSQDMNHASNRSASNDVKRKHGLPYSKLEDELLLRCRDVDKLDWKDILSRLPGRSIGSISSHHSELKSRSLKNAGPPQSQTSRPTSYSQADDALLLKLRDENKLEWNDIRPYFPGRALGSMAGHYGQLKVKSKPAQTKAPPEIQSTTHAGTHGAPYSAGEDALLKKLKEVDDLTWDEIVSYFSGRTRGSLQVRYSSKLKSIDRIQHPSPRLPVPAATPNKKIKTNTNHGEPYSGEEDARIVKMLEEGLSWDQMVAHFNGRTAGSLAVRYSSKLKDRATKQSHLSNDVAEQPQSDERPQRRRRHNEPSVLSGFISWAEIKRSRQNVFDEEEAKVEHDALNREQIPRSSSENIRRSPSKSLARILRHRELGNTCGHGLPISSRSISDDLKQHVFDDMGPRKWFQGTSGDVTCVAWAKNGNHFAAGSIAITDERSMQYNRSCNLLLGDVSRSILRELPEHHIQRPVNTDIANVNSLQSMRETQDPRLFMTVAGVQFSPDGRRLYSAGTDRKVRAYAVDESISHQPQLYEIEHPAPIYLLSISNQNVLATACHQATNDSIRIHREQNQVAAFSPNRADSQTDRPIFPSALRWGTSSHHSNLLLAGFSIDSIDEERNLAGETCLWDIHHGVRIEVNAVTRNVFDVTWNPSPSTGSTAFAVAGTPGFNKVNRGTKSVVQCFAPQQNRATAVLEFESPAFDINDVVYCPHDNALIAAGATDGKVYVWDQRYATKGSEPLHVLSHDRSLNVLDHDRDRELADTGVRFLQWGATSSRLYSGSSDGTVKLWNPYRSSTNAHVKDVVTFTSAVMSGAFSPDYRNLLVGEDQGKINLLSIGHGNRSIRSMERFDIQPAPIPTTCVLSDGRDIARTLLTTGEVELNKMGALPIRQAVQGPNYAGPFVASAMNTGDAESEYQIALNLQHEAHSKAAADSTQNSDSEKSLQEADERVARAQNAMLLLQDKFDDAEALKPRAEELQRSFRKAERERRQLEASLSYELQRCTLNCNYLPTSIDKDLGVPDSRRSEQRIPSELWSFAELDGANMDSQELKDAGLVQKCASCRRPAPEPRSGLPLCSICTRQKLGLTATCEVCSARIRPTFEKHGANLCERCNFSCFRCGAPAFPSPTAESISCYKCELSWSAGALGYELRKG